MQQIFKDKVLDRVKVFYRRLENYVIVETSPLEAIYSLSDSPIPFSERLAGDYSPIAQGQQWGTAWQSGWFHITGEIPKAWGGKCVAVQVNLNGEGLIFSEDGLPLWSISNVCVFEKHFVRDMIYLSDSAKGGEQVNLWCEAAANCILGIERDTFPIGEQENPDGHFQGKVNALRLCVVDKEIWHLRLDMITLIELLETLPETDSYRSRILRTLNDTCDIFSGNPANAASCRKRLQDILKLPASASALQATAVGHAHIDVAWQWPVRETIRKCGRTFANQVQLLEKYPKYVFGASQPQLYEFTKEHYPELYRKIGKFVEAGRWELQGGMWVEADLNIAGGEALIRQFLHGKNFYRDEFGVDVKTLWLPDVFGFSAILPQIAAQCGCLWLSTQKLSWNQTNTFPHHTFRWRGLDGTEIIVHCLPENTYNSSLRSDTIKKAADNFIENDFLDEFMVLFGLGDGGGGPSSDHIEHGLRQQNLEGAPRLKFGRADDFFKRLESRVSELSYWDGELYLENHRGALTTQGKIKKLNRQLEQKLRRVECLWSCLPLEKYPSDELRTVWKTLLINQFHDILPGSSISEVNVHTHRELEDAIGVCDKLITHAGKQLCNPSEESLTLFNDLNFAYNRPVELPENWSDYEVYVAGGQKVSVDGKYALPEVSPQSLIEPHRGEQRKTRKAENNKSNPLVLENALVKYVFNEQGELLNAFDRENRREVLKENRFGNILTLYSDTPTRYNAWNIDRDYENQVVDTVKGVKRERCDGEVIQEISFDLQIGNSSLNQRVVLTKNSKRLDFFTKVDWREEHRMLRVSFPVELANAKARFDQQFGFIERPHHRNTTWDMARYEVSAHRYADLSNYNYGAALLNDCKYGYKIFDNVIDLCLLRSPRYPDCYADLGTHEFVYSFLPHSGSLQDSDVVSEAGQLNAPVTLFTGAPKPECDLPCRLEGNGIEIAALKKAERENALIFRVVETLGRESNGKISSTNFNHIIPVDPLEWNELGACSNSGELKFCLKPFEIRTFKLANM